MRELDRFGFRLSTVTMYLVAAHNPEKTISVDTLNAYVGQTNGYVVTLNNSLIPRPKTAQYSCDESRGFYQENWR
jgi:hypothetical protein